MQLSNISAPSYFGGDATRPLSEFNNDDMNLIDENQNLECGECGNGFDPLARPGFLRFLSLVLFSNLVMIAVTLIIEIIRFVQHDLAKLP